MNYIGIFTTFVLPVLICIGMGITLLIRGDRCRPA